jgi:WhiB family redox-sensing transcriptional regulator
MSGVTIRIRRAVPDVVLAGAECAGTDPEPFFDSTRYAEARRLCWKCAVREACAEHAISAAEPEGVWGGLDPDQRAAVRRDRRRSRLRWTSTR